MPLARWIEGGSRNINDCFCQLGENQVFYLPQVGEVLGEGELTALALPGVDRLWVLGRRPSLPAGLRIYAIGDIHGRLDLLDELLARIETDIGVRPAMRSLYVFLGDYIDRGPSSRETIDRLIELGEKSECVFLKGNHELIAIKCLSDRSRFDQWMRLGGVETLNSYKIAAQGVRNGKRIVELQTAFHQALPQAHFRFLRDLQTSFMLGDFFFAHAGVNPNVDLTSQKESDLLWIREEFLSSKIDFGKIVVHGHTPVYEVDVSSNRVNIDTGAFATGRLTCLVIEEESLAVIST
ncbi:metallophosphoesterase family protein [Bradyrhizobium australiense]|uniref:Serine/threonine protein phosphatase n=1 Tax=Bradyrhizobium australiense TaxID=2721161 RepID=A0A7Y4LYW8_9BRAD|nr:metallophosphoesterase family protein [Bradyrhizobium australiense]NOJ43696.1 serine/threonine protein phosphatase [Bradyrhizobium australiense]